MNKDETLENMSIIILSHIEELYMQKKLSIRAGRKDSMNSMYWKWDKYYFLYTQYFNHSMRDMGTYEISDEENKYISIGMKMIDQHLSDIDTKKFNKFVDTFSGTEYEIYCLHELEKYGWDAKATKGGGDFGADIIAEKKGKKMVLQCKRHKNRIGISAVKDIFAANAYYKGDLAVVCSNMDYSKPSRDLA